MSILDGMRVLRWKLISWLTEKDMNWEYLLLHVRMSATRARMLIYYEIISFLSRQGLEKLAKQTSPSSKYKKTE